VRDGLKPVHRRVLFAMHEPATSGTGPYKKCARIVGDVMGKYHPHGDSAIYDALVRMAQDFSLRYPLVDGQGNFGSIDGDNAAAMRYTECRLAQDRARAAGRHRQGNRRLPAQLRRQASSEPTVLPARLPNLLINGSRRHRGGHGHQHPAAQPQRGRRRLPAAAVDNPDVTDRRADGARAGAGLPDRRRSSTACSGVREGYRTGRGRVVMRAQDRTSSRSRGRRAPGDHRRPSCPTR
jgi:DNA gyrase subunit A